MEQENTNIVDPQKESVIAKYPAWPRSKPGPEVTTPPPGMHPKAERPEQVVEVGYNQETGEPGNTSLERAQVDPGVSAAPDQERDAEIARSRERHQKNR